MRVLRSIILSFVALGTLITAGSTSVVYAHKTVTTQDCTVMSTGKKNTAGNADSRFAIHSDGTVTATFTVTGTDCNVPVTIAAWQVPNADKGQPYDQQKLFAHNTSTFAAGTHSLTITPPNCFYQIDLIRGSSATGPNGSAVYDTGVLMGSLHGGTQTCTPPTIPPELPKTGNGTAVLAISGVLAVAGYITSVARKAHRAQA